MTAVSEDVTPDARRVPDPKLRRTRRIPLGAAIVGIVLAALTGVLGGDGRVGLVVFLLVTSVGAGLGALYGIVTAVVDDLKQRPVDRRRPITAVVLFLVAAMLMAMVAAAGG